MARKIGGRWYRRAWAEGTKVEAERELERMKKGSSHHLHVLVAEIRKDMHGKEEKMFSIFYRPRKFKNDKERNDWNRISAEFQKEDLKMARKGGAYTRLAR